MFVTSKRCYLNILTQILDKKTLLNANYYIADIRSPDGVSISNSFDFDFDATDNFVEPASYALSLNEYNIKYDQNATLDPTPLSTFHGDMERLFSEELNSMTDLINIYNFLFREKPYGNGLQILIFNSDSIIENFGSMICNHLCNIFGETIYFIDGKYRANKIMNPRFEFKPVNTPKQIEKNIMAIRDAQLVQNFKIQYSSSDPTSAQSNIAIFLSSFDVHGLIHLHNLLFANDPLPPDNYNASMLVNIIINKTMDTMPLNQYQELLVYDIPEQYEWE